MNITIRLEGEPNEIAALVSELQERQGVKLVLNRAEEKSNPVLSPNDIVECKELC